MLCYNLDLIIQTVGWFSSEPCLLLIMRWMRVNVSDGVCVLRQAMTFRQIYESLPKWLRIVEALDINSA